MAGYVMGSGPFGALDRPFYIDDTNVVTTIHRLNQNKRVIRVQLDGDEMAAFLWGLEHYEKES